MHQTSLNCPRSCFGKSQGRKSFANAMLHFTNCEHNTDKNEFYKVSVALHNIIFLSRQQFKYFTEILTGVQMTYVELLIYLSGNTAQLQARKHCQLQWNPVKVH